MTTHKRKPISKKVRFEVFKKDGFKCVYCGKTPPNVTLEVDHIDPVSKGGESDIFNYVTACFDCNRGKSNIPLDKIPPSMSDNLEILKIKEEQFLEYKKFVNKIKKRETKDINRIDEIYRKAFKGWCLADHFKKSSLIKFIRRLGVEKVDEAMNISISKMSDSEVAIKYFCGICWRMINNPDGDL